MTIAEKVARITYKPGWTFSLFTEPLWHPTLCINIMALDSNGSGRTIQLTARYAISLDRVDDDDHFKAFVYHCICQCELHETDEWLKFDGTPYLVPHQDIEKKDLTPVDRVID